MLETGFSPRTPGTDINARSIFDLNNYITVLACLCRVWLKFKSTFTPCTHIGRMRYEIGKYIAKLFADIGSKQTEICSSAQAQTDVHKYVNSTSMSRIRLLQLT